MSADQLAALSEALSHIVAKTAPSLVSVETRRTRASGFVWRPGFIVTSDEALPEDAEVWVRLNGGERIDAQVVGRDPTTAVALLKIERADIPQLTLSKTGVLAGALALAIGSSDGAPLAAQTAIALATGPWRSLRDGEISARIELDRRLRGAAEGGAALDVNGAAFGMLVEGPRHRALVIPADTIERVAATLRDKGRIPRGYLGLALQPAPVDDGVGAIVISLDKDGPGARSGVRQGDVIVAVDGAPVKGLRNLLRGLGPDSIGRILKLGLRRGGDPLDLDIAIGERPA